MHRIEIKLKTGETLYIGTMSDFPLAVTIVNSIWKQGYNNKDYNLKPEHIAEIHLTTYLGTK